LEVGDRRELRSGRKSDSKREREKKRKICSFTGARTRGGEKKKSGERGGWKKSPQGMHELVLETRGGGNQTQSHSGRLKGKKKRHKGKRKDLEQVLAGRGTVRGEDS